MKNDTHEVKNYISSIVRSLDNVTESVAELELRQERAAEVSFNEKEQKALSWLSLLNSGLKQVDTFERH